MASTNKTANLGLSQWEQTDPFSREDLNSDMRKIDESVSRFKLFDITVTVETMTATIQLDLDGLDLSEFALLEIFFNSAMLEKRMRINGVTSEIYRHISNNTYIKSYIPITGNVSRMSLSDRRLINRVDGEKSFDELYESEFFPLKSLQLFAGSANFQPGERVTVWGVRR